MDGVKRAAKNRNSSWMVFRCRTFRLRRRQSASRMIPYPILSRIPTSGTRIIPPYFHSRPGF
jgi:hypothetical protein